MRNTVLRPLFSFQGNFFTIFLFCTRKQIIMLITHENLNYMDAVGDKMHGYNSSMIILISKAMLLWDFQIRICMSVLLLGLHCLTTRKKTRLWQDNLLTIPFNLQTRATLVFHRKCYCLLIESVESGSYLP